mmetsp:Transcript_5526/g.11456  ORF Transcript_5526/g.11456 Transcript_5526/m.11456 type:complete len:247 (-) Transcript_5526:467-1207(-)
MWTPTTGRTCCVSCSSLWRRPLCGRRTRRWCRSASRSLAARQRRAPSLRRSRRSSLSPRRAPREAATQPRGATRHSSSRRRRWITRSWVWRWLCTARPVRRLAAPPLTTLLEGTAQCCSLLLRSARTWLQRSMLQKMRVSLRRFAIASSRELWTQWSPWKARLLASCSTRRRTRAWSRVKRSSRSRCRWRRKWLGGTISIVLASRSTSIVYTPATSGTSITKRTTTTTIRRRRWCKATSSTYFILT